ncbi:hypothetical protein K449DRAFT_146982 [Hypoxylon sp. EC38]|nr:hypothetical protein K449DRAFT_146982 [Hypoxylon sp. EC38]
MNPSAHQSSQAPAQRSRRTYSPERRDTPSAHSHPRPVDRRLFGQEARRCEATQDQTRLRCEATHYLLPTDIANAWDRKRERKKKRYLAYPIYQLCPATSTYSTYYILHTTTSTSFARGCSLFFPLLLPIFFLVCGRLPPSSDAAKCKSVTGEYASFTRSTTRCHGSAHAFCPPG